MSFKVYKDSNLNVLKANSITAGSVSTSVALADRVQINQTIAQQNVPDNSIIASKHFQITNGVSTPIITLSGFDALTNFAYTIYYQVSAVTATDAQTRTGNFNFVGIKQMSPDHLHIANSTVNQTFAASTGTLTVTAQIPSSPVTGDSVTLSVTATSSLSSPTVTIGLFIVAQESNDINLVTFGP